MSFWGKSTAEEKLNKMIADENKKLARIREAHGRAQKASKTLFDT